MERKNSFTLRYFCQKQLFVRCFDESLCFILGKRVCLNVGVYVSIRMCVCVSEGESNMSEIVYVCVWVCVCVCVA